jgi:hypothetical protein
MVHYLLSFLLLQPQLSQTDKQNYFNDVIAFSTFIYKSIVFIPTVKGKIVGDDITRSQTHFTMDNCPCLLIACECCYGGISFPISFRPRFIEMLKVEVTFSGGLGRPCPTFHFILLMFQQYMIDHPENNPPVHLLPTTITI